MLGVLFLIWIPLGDLLWRWNCFSFVFRVCYVAFILSLWCFLIYLPFDLHCLWHSDGVHYMDIQPKCSSNIFHFLAIKTPRKRFCSLWVEWKLRDNPQVWHNSYKITLFFSSNSSGSSLWMYTYIVYIFGSTWIPYWKTHTTITSLTKHHLSISFWM